MDKVSTIKYKKSYKAKLDQKNRKEKKLGRCQRCKNEYPRKSNERICEICRTLCSTCGVQLTHENIDKSCTVKRKAYRCKACVATGVRETRKPENQKDYDLQRTYGITFEEYKILLDSQNGVCWICSKPPGTKALHVDHKHQKGEKEIRRKGGVVLIRQNVRGLLCWHCNHTIGKMKDDPSLLRKAAEYLETEPAKSILKKGKVESG